jgi:hypothetical protein
VALAILRWRFANLLDALGVDLADRWWLLMFPVDNTKRYGIDRRCMWRAGEKGNMGDGPFMQSGLSAMVCAARRRELVL